MRVRRLERQDSRCIKSICARVSPARWTGYKAYTADNEVKRSSGQWREGRQDVLLSYHSAASPLNLNQRGPTPSLRIRVAGIAAEALLKMPGPFRIIAKNSEV